MKQVLGGTAGWPIWILPVVTTISIASVVWSVHRFFSVINARRNCRFGLRGEQAVAEALNQSTIIVEGYRVFHDVPGAGAWNIDHVVVGTSGIYVLETKARSRRKCSCNGEDHVVEFDGRTLRFPAGEDHEAARQVQRNAEWLEKLLKDFVPEGLSVKPVLVLPGWYVKTLGKYSVISVNAKYLVGYLAREPKRFTQDQLKAAMRYLDERCRDVEF